MAKKPVLNIRDSLTPELDKLAAKVKDLSVPMSQVKTEVMEPLKSTAWSSGGVKSETGEIKKSVQTFSGKVSAGVGFKSKGLGRTDAGLAVARGTLLNRGAQKNQHRRKEKTRVKAHIRKGLSVREHIRRNNGSPWGTIKARKFFPTKLPAGSSQEILKIIEKYVQSKR